MGKSWKNPLKVANAQKKGAIFTKYAREIQVAAKAGGPDPATNSRLRLAIDSAKKHSCPNDTIDRAIKKGAGLSSDASQIEELQYEGYGPHKVGVIVDCLTDNRNRTVPEIRSIFKSHDGHLGESGSVSWMFKRVSMIEGTKSGNYDPDEEAIEAGADDVHKDTESCSFYGAPEDLDKIRTALAARGWHITQAELSFLPNNTTELTPAQKKDVEDFLTELDDFDDTHRVYATISN